MIKDFVQSSHTADLQIKVYGQTIAELFKHALYGMFQVMQPQSSLCNYHSDRISCKTLSVTRSIGVNSPDLNALLVDFLSYAIYLSDVHNEAYFDVNFSILTNQNLMGNVYGVPITGFNQSEIKAITYHSLNIVQQDGLWQTDIVFDI